MKTLKETEFSWHSEQPDVPQKTAAEMKAFFDAPIHVLLDKINEIIDGKDDDGKPIEGSLKYLLTQIMSLQEADGTAAEEREKLEENIEKNIESISNLGTMIEGLKITGVLPIVSGSRSIEEIPLGISMAKNSDEGEELEITYDPPNVELVGEGSLLFHTTRTNTNEDESFTYHYLNILPAGSVKNKNDEMCIHITDGVGGAKRYVTPYPQYVMEKLQETLTQHSSLLDEAMMWESVLNSISEDNEDLDECVPTAAAVVDYIRQKIGDVEEALDEIIREQNEFIGEVV
ncbi:MAG: hypothetical protein IKY33_01300 [Clostridia bacterium]|nr:hypothetical protein [Clostridia bacterium]